MNQLKNKVYIETLTKRFIIHLLHIQNRLYYILDEGFNDIVTSKISEYFLDNNKDFWKTIKNGFSKKHINQLKEIFDEITEFIQRLNNDSIEFYFKQKKTNIDTLIKRIK